MVIEGTLILIKQILLLFIMIGVGYLAGAVKKLDSDGSKQLTNLILFFLTPAVIFSAFQIDYDPRLATNMLIAAGVAVLTIALGILLSKIIYRGETPDRKRLLTFGTAFFNAGFFTLPLLAALLGNEGVIYGAVFVAVFNIALWTYGVRLMSDSGSKIDWKNLLNPNLFAIFFGLICFTFSLELPEIVGTTLTSLGSMQSPLAMIVIGTQFYVYRKAFTLADKGIWKLVFTRNLLIPLLMLPIAFLVAKDSTLFFTCILTAAAPAPLNTVLFATRFDRDVCLGIQAVFLTTFLVAITLPLIMMIGGLLVTPVAITGGF